MPLPVVAKLAVTPHRPRVGGVVDRVDHILNGLRRAEIDVEARAVAVGDREVGAGDGPHALAVVQIAQRRVRRRSCGCPDRWRSCRRSRRCVMSVPCVGLRMLMPVPVGVDLRQHAGVRAVDRVEQVLDGRRAGQIDRRGGLAVGDRQSAGLIDARAAVQIATAASAA